MSIEDDSMTCMFGIFKAEMETEQELREKIRETVRENDQQGRDMLTILQKIHQSNAGEKIAEICAKIRKMFEQVKLNYAKLASLIPENEYCKYSDHYRFLNQRMVFLAALLKYLESGQMISLEEAAETLGIACNRREGFHIDIEDYLHGLLNLATELSRFTTNCVTCGDYEKPFKIAAFLTDLDSGFRLLNLKNDGLRKRFDALKYDVKKVEEVVYDLSIRGLKSRDQK